MPAARGQGFLQPEGQGVVPGATSGSMFTPVQVELVAAEPEIAGLDLLYKTKYSKVGKYPRSRFDLLQRVCPG